VRVKRIEAAYTEIARAFERAGVEHLVIKGFAQYPDFAILWSTACNRISIFIVRRVHPCRPSRLRSLGYEAISTLDKFPADHLPEMTRKQGWRWRGNAYDPEMPPGIDLHFCFWNFATTFLSIPGVNEFWGRRIEPAGGLSFPALSPIDNLAFNALHILRDLQRGDWVIHHVYELACFLHTHAEDEHCGKRGRHTMTITARAAGNFLLAGPGVVQLLLGGAIDREVSRIPRPVRQWLDRFSQSPLTGMFHPNKHGVWLHLSLLESRWDRLLVWAARCFLFGFRLWVLPGRTPPSRRKRRKFWPSQRYAKYRIARRLPRRIPSSNLAQHPLARLLLVV
jgi:hypothetical protein